MGVRRRVCVRAYGLRAAVYTTRERVRVARICVVCQVLLAHKQGVRHSTPAFELGQGLSPRTTVRIQERRHGAQSTLCSPVSQGPPELGLDGAL